MQGAWAAAKQCMFALPVMVTFNDLGIDPLNFWSRAGCAERGSADAPPDYPSLPRGHASSCEHSLHRRRLDAACAQPAGRNVAGPRAARQAQHSHGACPPSPVPQPAGRPLAPSHAPALGLSMDARSLGRGDISVETCVCSRAQAIPIKLLSSDWSLLFCQPILLRDQFATPARGCPPLPPCCRHSARADILGAHWRAAFRFTGVDRCATRQHASSYRLLWKGTRYEHQTKGWCRFRKASAGSKATIKTTALTAVRDVLYDDVCVCRSGCLGHMCMQHVF